MYRMFLNHESESGDCDGVKYTIELKVVPTATTQEHPYFLLWDLVIVVINIFFYYY